MPIGSLKCPLYYISTVLATQAHAGWSTSHSIQTYLILGVVLPLY